MIPELRRVLENRQRILVLLWLCFLAALALYLLIPQFILTNESSVKRDFSSEVIRGALWLMMLMGIGVVMELFLTNSSGK